MVDPVTVEVIRNALSYSAEEMGIALRNSAYSHNIKERMDHSCAIFDTDGNMVAQAEHIPVHLGSLPHGIKNAINYLKQKGLTFREGDIFIFNDPYISGTHLNDVTLIKPVFYKGKHVGFTANKAHHVDVGGKSPGSMSGDATELYQEGIIIPPVKFAEAGEIRQDVLSFILENVRTPHITQGDLRAQMAAANLGARRIHELIDKYGIELYLRSLDQILRYSEKRMMEEIRGIPDGVYEAADCLEDSGVNDRPVWIRVKVTVYGGRMKVDYTGTDPQVEGPINAVFGVTLSATYFAIKSVVDPEVPMNQGAMRPIEVYAPPGTLVNPFKPAPVSGGNVETSQRIADVMFRALSYALPEKVPAASLGSMNNIMAGGYDPRRKRPWAFYETIGGGSGGRPFEDGIDGIHTNMTNTMNTPIEAIEQYYPIIFTAYEFRENSFGAGKFRGGNGIVRSWKLNAPKATVSILAERTKVTPFGVHGGLPGKPAEFYLVKRDGETLKLNGKTTVVIERGDEIVIKTAGGGGYGPPEERDPVAIKEDMENGLLGISWETYVEENRKIRRDCKDL